MNAESELKQLCIRRKKLAQTREVVFRTVGFPEVFCLGLTMKGLDDGS